jgi:CheY-like chemotaxis protein
MTHLNSLDKRLSASYQRQMQPTSILLVEDEALIRIMLFDMLEELGHRVVAEAGSIKDAQALAETAMYDLAILDVNLDGHSIEPIADIIHRRGLPFVFMTGYGSSGLPAAFADKPHLQKPCSLEKLRQVLNTVLAE